MPPDGDTSDDWEWVVVAEAAPEAGEIQSDDAHDVVVWRTFDGRPCVMDARCPHEWSHLGAEGVVDGDELVCAAHFWRFDTDGVGTKLNVKGRRDPKSDVEVFECREDGGRIWAHLRRAALLVAAALVLVATFGSARPAAAQDSFERVVQFTSDMTVRRDGSLDVSEHIVYDFGPNQRHGILRYIPNRFPYDGKKPDSYSTYDRVTLISDVHVTSDAPSDLQTEDQNGNLVMRIGDSARTVTGRHTYDISYRIAGVFNGFPDHDELYFNVTGNGWTVPIESVRATVTGPVDPTDSACFAGPNGSQLPCSSHTVDGKVARFTQEQVLPAGSGVTVVVAYPKGTVVTAPILEETPTLKSAFRPSPLNIGGGLGLLALGAAGIGVLLWRHGRDRRFRGSATDAAFSTSGEDEPVPLVGKRIDPVEFVPPDGIRPGHMGTLWDEVANPLDVSAMIVDLAVRGYLRIEELSTEGPGGAPSSSGDYRFVKTKGPDDALLHSESLLLESLFRDGDTTTLGELRQHFAQRLDLVEGALYDDAVDAGWFAIRPDRVRARWLGYGLATIVAGAVITYFAARYTHVALFALAIPIVGVLIVALNKRFPSRTAKGTALLGRVRGFRELFSAGEGERQDFLAQKGIFSQYLPYAIVFGMTDQWAHQFQALGLSDADLGVGGWYVSPFGYNPITFAYAMNGFSTIATGSIAMAAPSSAGGISGGSGFSGGGFSGGGFGGGGGGSW